MSQKEIEFKAKAEEEAEGEDGGFDYLGSNSGRFGLNRGQVSSSNNSDVNSYSKSLAAGNGMSMTSVGEIFGSIMRGGSSSGNSKSASGNESGSTLDDIDMLPNPTMEGLSAHGDYFQDEDTDAAIAAVVAAAAHPSST
jgi:hypothetical protein